MTALAGSPRKVGGDGIQPGGAQPDFVRTLVLGQISAAGSVGATTTYGVLVRVGRSLSITQMAYAVGTAAGNVDIGIYQSDGTTLTLVASSGPTAAVGANAMQTINLATPYTMQPGVDYYLAIWVASATLTVYRTSGVPLNAVKNQAVSKSTGGTALPASITIATMTAGAPAVDLAAMV